MFNKNYYLCWFFIILFLSMILFMISLYYNMKSLNYFIEFEVLNFNSVTMCYIIYLDWVSLSFMSVVLLISSMVGLYSSQYMGYKAFTSIRFLYLVLAFVFSMLLMIISPSMVSILLGWDGLGLVSYCLVIFYSSVKSYLAGMITCLTNRLGDVGLLISICWMMSYGSWHFLFYSHMFNKYLYFLVIISCFTKSAQIPFSCWLPAAMAAPTPVSALVHSSTLVTAGVYLLIRFMKNYNYSHTLIFISTMTMLLSSICALFEFDLKKIIALSTLSQLGLMMTSLFLGLNELSFFHLLTHALFKSLLFLCAGILIFYMNDNQDIRLMGATCVGTPYTTCCMNVSSMALCGIPFMAGFYSKDSIIEYSLFNDLNLFLFICLYMSLGLTIGYSFRLMNYSMIYMNKFNPMCLFLDSFDNMKLSIGVLSVFSVISGAMIMWVMNLDMMFMVMPVYLSILTIMFVLMGMWVSYEMSFLKCLLSLKFYMFNSYMWFMYSHSFLMYKLFYNSSFILINTLLNWGEFYGGSGLSFYLMKLSNSIQLWMFNSLSTFLLSFLLWIVIII
uniref:NADH dehydrogenase subunit 5 n=1 Tax=Amritodus flavoscutatus TaxID=2479863 RepID=UPI002E7A09C3|nr:NADH dehydrogenase subunit 5 [Amritodus flavoscutatus]WQF70194.1 NADH dehydrogenase subunit 5 [Amritodus flavoscutatus]